ncbi:hypothetical protein TEU_08555 [Thermococcus eurythermalis]|uniref:Uncharacterized protein n=1 Tax=Thermococcus eurythermalis TaxID=1505907 RepID=A0A097QV74_9EURY|nr:DUF5646 family protein [Thermococcus eurythermalis]AIU70376.1 hypothetical protein TEU_08555 [Thermococcus eurythermalis]
MERVSEATVRHVMEELERLKVEVQRLEALLVPLVKNELSAEEVEEIEREAREFHEEEWVNADDLEDLLEDDL